MLRFLAMNIFKAIWTGVKMFFVGVVAFLTGAQTGPAEMKQEILPESNNASESAQVATVAAATTEKVRALVTLTPVPTVVSLTPSPTPEPEIDQQLIDECATASVPVTEFAGESCYPANENLRFINARLDKTFSEEEVDGIFVNINGNDLKQKIVDQCYKADKLRFESCNESIRRNEGRLRDELIKKHESELNSCLNHASAGDGKVVDRTRRYFARNKMEDNVSAIYDFCYSNGDSVDNFHF